MSGSRTSELSQRLQASLGTPPDLKAFSPFPFSGMNQEASPIAMSDQEFYWLENFVKTGDGKLRALYDADSPLYTSPSTTVSIIKFASFNISTTYYFIVFLSDGTAVQVNRDTGATTTITSVAGTFYTSGSNLPDCCPSGGQYLLIANNHKANAYWIWDGLVLYAAGSISPSITLTSGGSGYSSAPTVTAFGGSGTGATFTASVVNGSVVAVQTTSPGTGYVSGDVVQLQFTGGGSDGGAILTAVLAAASVDHLTLLAGGSGYTSPPAVVFSSGAATASALLSPTSVAGATITNGGTGYTSAPTVLISGGGGSGATATATVAAGAVTAITITGSGSGYTSLPTLSFTGGGGASAAATAVLSPSSVGALTITNHGAGYTSSPAISFTGGGGSGAQALAVLSSGSVASVTVTNGGSGFTGTPTLTFSGGNGNGATATAILTAGVITSVTVTAGGSGYTGAPAITVSPGFNNSAAGSVAIMPYGISGGAIENYLSRVWLVNLYRPGVTPTGGKMIASAPGSLVDFAGSDGGVGYTSTDRYLRAQYNAIRQSNGYLYPFGDSSASVISGVQTSGSPASTTFNYQNTDPQTGTNFRDSMVEYGRSLIFVNKTGVYGLYGGAVTKISGKVDKLFEKAVFPPTAGAITPTAAVVTLFKIKMLAVAMTIVDPRTAVQRNIVLLWDEKNWYVASQSLSVNYLSGEVRNSDLSAWGTDGVRLCRLFNTPSSNLVKTATGKLYGADALFYDKLALRFYVSGESHGTDFVAFNWYTNYGQGTIPSPVNPVSLSNGGVDLAAGMTNDVNAPLLGFTITSQTADFSLYSLVLTYQLQTYIG